MKTRRELKHELLLTFIEQAKKQNSVRQRTTKPRILKALFSIFF